MLPTSVKKALISKMEQSFADAEAYMGAQISNYIKTHKVKECKILDVGVGTGEKTINILKGIKKTKIYGIDAVNLVKSKRITFKKCDLEKNVFPFKENYFDIVMSNQTIEHILDKDHFLEQSYKVLKPNGLFIVATENISSFDNIISLILGQEPLVQHGAGTKKHVNSILSPQYMHSFGKDYTHKYGHKNVASFHSLVRMLKVNGFSDVEIKSFGNIHELFEKLFPIYNRIIVAKGTKSLPE